MKARTTTSTAMPPKSRARLRPWLAGTRAFTLIEALLALATSAIVLAAIGGVFYSALRLRERTLAAVDESLPLYQALNVLRRDLKGALPPGGLLAADFKSGPAGSMGLGLSYWIQFSTTTGVITPNEPWGDVQEVVYELRPSMSGRNGAGTELVRTASRNLLTTTHLDAEEDVLLENIESLEFACFDGLQWRDAWDTSLYETNLPLAVRVRIQLEMPEDVDRRNLEPVELVVPLVSQARTNLVETAEEVL